MKILRNMVGSLFAPDPARWGPDLSRAALAQRCIAYLRWHGIAAKRLHHIVFSVWVVLPERVFYIACVGADGNLREVHMKDLVFEKSKLPPHADLAIFTNHAVDPPTAAIADHHRLPLATPARMDTLVTWINQAAHPPATP